ncbi:hypothetical protein VPH35_106758 [Triticum aestivum]
MAAKGRKDRLGDLTDDLLHHVLSLLPPEDALKTCVLDTRWRALWRRTTNMHFNAIHCERCEQLVKLFIQLRGNSPLPKCEISTSPDDHPHHTDLIYTNTELLIDYALECQVKELLLRAGHIDDDAIILDMPLISSHLKILHLQDVTCSAMNFSGCPVLEELKMEYCDIYAHKISSKSLKRLCITEQCSVPQEFHIRIFAPDLISLQISNFHGATPFLGDMPFLVTAYIGLCDGCHDSCEKDLRGCEMNQATDLPAVAFAKTGGWFPSGNPKNLRTRARTSIRRFIYSLDLKCCPIFDKLKTLLLNEWFTAIDLVRILQHSSILEIFILRTLRNNRTIICMCTPKVVNIECRIDGGIHKIVNILSTCGILRDQINSKDPYSRSYSAKPLRPPPPLVPEMCVLP